MSALNLSKGKKTAEPKPKKEKKVKAKKQAAEPKAAKVKPAKSGIAAKKIPADKYTLLLLLAWLTMIAACVMMYLDLVSYQS